MKDSLLLSASSSPLLPESIIPFPWVPFPALGVLLSSSSSSSSGPIWSSISVSRWNKWNKWNYFLVFKQVLTDWFAWKNVDDTIIFIQYLLQFYFSFVQLLSILFPSNLEVCFTSAPSWPACNISTELYLHWMVNIELYLHWMKV